MRETIDKGGRPPDQRDWLRQEVERWVSERLIRPEQAQMILARYGLFEGESPRSLKQTQIVHLVTVAGAVLMGIGVLVIVGANWEMIPRLGRLVVLIVATLAFYAGGYWLAYERQVFPGVGKALILVGSLVWVSSIFLVAQMFHLGGEGDPEYARGLLYGFIGLIPLAYVLRSPVQLALALVVGTLWLFLGWPAGPIWETAGPWLFLKLLAVGPLLYVIGLVHRQYETEETLAPAYTKYGIALASVSLFVLSFEGTMRIYGDTQWNRLPWVAYGAIIAMTIAGAAWVAWRAWQLRERTGPAEAAACVVLALVAAVLPLMVKVSPGYGQQVDVWGAMILANVLLLALEIGCIWVGWSRAQPGLINWGLTLFFIHLMTRYFDLFAELLPTGAAFIGAGALLLLAGFGLERQRRHLLQTMPGAPEGRPPESRPPGDMPGTLPEGGMA